MRIVFLDFDGCLNSESFVRACGDGVAPVDPACVARLNRIIERTGAKVVISSSWRLMYKLPKLRRVLGAAGFTGDVIGVTPDLTTFSRSGLAMALERGHEIQRWIDKHKWVEPNFLESFVILDDDADMAHLAPRLVRTSFATGLTDEDVEAAVRLLETPVEAGAAPEGRPGWDISTMADGSERGGQ